MFTVQDLAGSPVSGLTAAAFTLALTRRSGSSMISSSETVTVSSQGGGLYWVAYTPTAAATLYRLTITPVSGSHVVDPGSFQDDVESDFPTTAGPYFTTRDRFKTAFAISDDRYDAAIDQLLPQVTEQLQGEFGRTIFEATLTEYPQPLSRCATILLVKNPPITSITSLHVSTDIPRVYDATTLLVNGTDYLLSEDGQWIEFPSPLYFPSGSMSRAVQVIYVGGYATVPGDIEEASQRLLAVKLYKATGQLYHLAGENRADGGMSGVRFDDITPNVEAVINRYRLGTIV